MTFLDMILSSILLTPSILDISTKYDLNQVDILLGTTNPSLAKVTWDEVNGFNWF